jgi:glucan phosphoethanolaminetransferase (alkaline phosphatase superfamily)
VPVTRNFAQSITLLTLIWIALDLLILTLWIIAVRRYVSLRYERAIRLATALFMLVVAIYGAVWNGNAIWVAFSEG